jgi:hypothetical protein
MYEIIRTTAREFELVQIVPNIEAARDHLANFVGEIIAFELDADADYDAADAAVLVNGNLEIYAIERIA